LKTAEYGLVLWWVSCPCDFSEYDYLFWKKLL